MMRQKFADNVGNISNSIPKGRPQMPRCVCVYIYSNKGVWVRLENMQTWFEF